ncbi:hypothetical protein LguiA_009710 [Lonicera macranthoides]
MSAEEFLRSLCIGVVQPYKFLFLLGVINIFVSSVWHKKLCSHENKACTKIIKQFWMNG